MRPMTVRSLGSLLTCDAAWEQVGPESVHIWEPLDVDLPADVEVYCAGSAAVRFYPEGTTVVVFHHRIMGDLLLLDDGLWYEVTAGQAVHRDGQWCMRWRACSNTRLARMLNACPAKVARRTLAQHVGGHRG